MRYFSFFLFVSFFCWGWSQEKTELRYDFTTLHQKIAHYRTRFLLHVEQKKGEATLEMKTTLEQVQKRTFQQDDTHPLSGQISIQFEEMWIKQDSKTTLPDQSNPQYSWNWKSNNPQQLIHQELGPIPLKNAYPADRQKILQLQQMMEQPLQLTTTTTGEIQKLSWPNVPAEQTENFKKSWILLPNKPLSLGESWEQTLQENLGGIGLLQIQITYLLKEIDIEKQIASIIGYFHFTFNDTLGRNEKGIMTEFSGERGALIFDFDLKNKIIVRIHQEIQMTLTVKIPREGTELYTLTTKINNQFQENLESLVAQEEK